MTIDELISLGILTANDEIPVWDTEAAGEPTKKISAQNLAASVATLADLVGETELTAKLADKADKDDVDALDEEVDDLKSALDDSGLFPEPLPLTAGYYDLSTGVVNTNPGYLHTEIFDCIDYTKIIGVSEMTANADFCSLFMDDTYVGYVYTKDGRYSLRYDGSPCYTTNTHIKACYEY